MRAKDSDMENLKSTTDKLEANDPNENGGKLTVVDDLVQQNGSYVIPADKKKKEKETFKERVKRIMDAAEKAIQSSQKLLSTLQQKN